MLWPIFCFLIEKNTIPRVFLHTASALTEGDFVQFPLQELPLPGHNRLKGLISNYS